jgi:hypothetical protein
MPAENPAEVRESGGAAYRERAESNAHVDSLLLSVVTSDGREAARRLECPEAPGREACESDQRHQHTKSGWPEALALARGKTGARSILLTAGSDARGLVYALLELADAFPLYPELRVTAGVV